MIRDLLDFENPQYARYTQTGTWYPDIVAGPDNGGHVIRYEHVDMLSRGWRRLFGNVQDFNAGETSIRTPDLHAYKSGSIVKLQDGGTYTVLQAAKDYSTAPKQAYRIQGLPIGVTAVLRLVERQDGWEK